MSGVDIFLKQIKNPEKFGPGTWNVLTIMALDANTYAKKMHFIHTLELILYKIPCLDPCRKDATAYFRSHPPSAYWEIRLNGEDIGMFYYMVDFHNWVNRKLGKPQVSREKALQYYRNQDDYVCQEGCGEDEPEEPPQEPIEPPQNYIYGFSPI